MRLDKPIGTYLLFLPAAWGLSLGATSPSDWIHLTPLFYAGSVLLRGAGCTINDIWDADIDRQVGRTRSRPLAARQISPPAAFLFLGAQCAGGLVILSKLNPPTFLLASLSTLPLMYYPFAKRWTNYPQTYLGLTFNLSVLVATTATAGTVTAESMLLYGAGVCWTMVYDTIYAHQDKVDDAKMGVSSTALTFGEAGKPVLALFSAGKFAFLAALGGVVGLSWPYYACVGASTAHLMNQVASTDLSDAEQCQRAFTSNATPGVLVWLGIVLGRVIS